MTSVATAVLTCLLAGTPPAAASGTPIEAETFQATADWEVQAKLPGFSGEGYLGNRRRMLIAETHPRLKLTLDRAGKYDVWVRALLGGPADSGFHDREFSATTCAVLARCAGLPARCVWMCPFDQYENHCVAEVFYDGRWHLLDPEARAFYLEADNRTLAGYESLHVERRLAIHRRRAVRSVGRAGK